MFNRGHFVAGLNIAVIGATGAVGTVFLDILAQRRFPVNQIKLFASSRSVGKRIPFAGKQYTVEELTPEALKNSDVCFISADTSISKQWAPIAAKQGAIVIDDSSAFRMEPDVPLVVPEVNGADLRSHKGVTAIPNCSTTPLVMALHALRTKADIKRVTVATYQAVSGTGRAAMDELTQQSKDVLAGKQPVTNAYVDPIAFNIFPHIDSFMDDGYTREEWKMMVETRKILHLPDLPVSATCVRVPVQLCHSEAVQVELSKPITPVEARQLFSKMPGVTVVDDPAKNQYPTPLTGAGKDDVYIGRVRKDSSHPNGLAFWLVSDNLRKGAALNAIQIAEELIKQGAFKQKAAAR